MTVRGFVLFVLFCSTWASAQLSGRFFLDKETYAHGEPVFLQFEVTNRGIAAVEIGDDDPYSYCGGYVVRVSSDPGPVPSTLPDSIEEGCGPNSITLAPGQTIHRRILLNFEHDVGAPGEYEVGAAKQLTQPESETSSEPVVLLELKESLHFRVERRQVSPAILNSWVRRLHSGDWQVADEAGRVLASLAPRAYEGVLLSFASDDNLKNWAPLAFYRLKTERSLAELAELVRKEEPNYPLHTDSTEFLARTGDLRWFPLLADVARKNAGSAHYAVCAAMLGGKKAMPLLKEFLRNSDPQVVSSAIAGLGATGSREAVPVLIDLLKDDTPMTAISVVLSLRQLTDVGLPQDAWKADPNELHTALMSWWTREGTTARIYKVNEQRRENDDPALP